MKHREYVMSSSFSDQIADVLEIPVIQGFIVMSIHWDRLMTSVSKSLCPSWELSCFTGNYHLQRQTTRPPGRVHLGGNGRVKAGQDGDVMTSARSLSLDLSLSLDHRAMEDDRVSMETSEIKTRKWIVMISVISSKNVHTRTRS